MAQRQKQQIYYIGHISTKKISLLQGRGYAIKKM